MIDAEFRVVCPECDYVFTIGGNELEIDCDNCGFTGGHDDFEDTEDEEG
jgi:primosomal protein N'